MSLNHRTFGRLARNNFGMGQQSGSIFPRTCLGLLFLGMGIAWQAAEAVVVLAQDTGTVAKKVPDPEDIDLTTGDGVLIKATYFKSTKGKEAVPVMMIHGYKGNRHDFDGLAKTLQAKGHAVIVPDLRGHGDSTMLVGGSKKLSADKFKPADFPPMVGKDGDLEAVKSFLVKRHNDGELNIDRLCVVGAEMGASVGLIWSALDWSWPMLTTGKQGQDVKAVVLISPKFVDHGFQISNALYNDGIKRIVSIYIVMGAEDNSAVKEAHRIYKLFTASHPDPGPAEPEKKDLFWDETKKTKLQGTKLLNEPTMQLDQYILSFIELRAEKMPFPWKERKQGD